MRSPNGKSRSPLIPIGRGWILTVERFTKAHPFTDIEAHGTIRNVTAKGGQPGPRKMLLFVQLDDESRTRHIIIARRHLLRADEVPVASVPAERVENPFQNPPDVRPPIGRSSAGPREGVIDEALPINSREEFPDSQFACTAMLGVSGRRRHHPQNMVRKCRRDKNSRPALPWEERDR